MPGCSEDVVLVDTTERPFTLYGLLNPQRDTQWVFVFPIEGRLDPGGGGVLALDQLPLVPSVWLRVAFR